MKKWLVTGFIFCCFLSFGFTQRLKLPLSRQTNRVVARDFAARQSDVLRYIPVADTFWQPYVLNRAIERYVFPQVVSKRVFKTHPLPSAVVQFSPFSLFTKIKTDAVIFDLDGTLLDSLGAWDNAGVNYLLSRGLEPYENMTEELVQLSLLDGARLIKKRYNLPETAEQILEDTLAPVKKHYQTDIPAKSKVPALLDYLRSEGIKMAVATASDSELTKAALARLGLLDYFEFIITCDEVGVGKRSPLVYETALTRLKTEKSRTLVVEDALYAVETAHKAGFPTVGIAEQKSALDAPKIAAVADLFISLE